MTKEQPGPRSVLRVLEIIQTIANNPNGMSLTELSATLGLPKTSTFSLLKALQAGAYVTLSANKYMLGLEAVNLGLSLNQPRSFTSHVRPIVEWLARETSETILLAVRTEDGNEISYADVIESEAPLRFAVRTGNRRPFYSAAAGIAVLAFLPPEFQQHYLSKTAFIKFTSHTLEKQQLAALLPDVRRSGVVLDANGMIEGAAAIASPAFNNAGRIACAIAIAGPTARMISDQRRLEKLATKGGQRISRLLGYSGKYPAKWPA